MQRCSIHLKTFYAFVMTIISVAQVFNDDIETGQYLRIQKVVSSKDSELCNNVRDLDTAQVMQAFQALDSTEHMEVLAQVGEQLGKAYRSSFKKWVQTYLVRPHEVS